MSEQIHHITKAPKEPFCCQCLLCCCICLVCRLRLPGTRYFPWLAPQSHANQQRLTSLKLQLKPWSKQSGVVLMDSRAGFFISSSGNICRESHRKPCLRCLHTYLNSLIWQKALTSGGSEEQICMSFKHAPQTVIILHSVDEGPPFWQ